ncbi:MAG: hypothetical protein OEZ27_06895, partial [Nitrospinota bacterium]|nr:hypothetical protein [Nitrospinota bacterium]
FFLCGDSPLITSQTQPCHPEPVEGRHGAILRQAQYDTCNDSFPAKGLSNYDAAEHIQRVF